MQGSVCGYGESDSQLWAMRQRCPRGRDHKAKVRRAWGEVLKGKAGQVWVCTNSGYFGFYL